MDIWLTWLQEQMSLPLNFWRLLYIILLIYFSAQVIWIPIRVRNIQRTLEAIREKLEGKK